MRDAVNAINKADGRRQLHAYDISSPKILILEKQSLMRSLMKQVFREFRVSEVEITAAPVKAFEFVTQPPRRWCRDRRLAPD